MTDIKRLVNSTITDNCTINTYVDDINKKTFIEIKTSDCNVLTMNYLSQSTGNLIVENTIKKPNLIKGE